LLKVVVCFSLWVAYRCSWNAVIGRIGLVVTHQLSSLVLDALVDILVDFWPTHRLHL
jgi:hypothetical protein